MSRRTGKEGIHERAVPAKERDQGRALEAIREIMEEHRRFPWRGEQTLAKITQALQETKS